MCGCPVSGYQASYRESESEHVFATGHASSVAGSRVRSDAPPTTASMRIELPPLESGVEYERTSREARRSPASRPALRAATPPGPRINPYSFCILASAPGQPRARSAIVPSRAGN